MSSGLPQVTLTLIKSREAASRASCKSRVTDKDERQLSEVVDQSEVAESFAQSHAVSPGFAVEYCIGVDAHIAFGPIHLDICLYTTLQEGAKQCA